MLFKDMKGVKLISCTSQASSAICSSIEPRSIILHQAGGRRRRAIAGSSPSTTTTTISDNKINNPPLHLPLSTLKPTVHLISPANSSRYLLNGTDFSDALREDLQKKESTASSSPSPQPNCDPQEQVVVLRVSLHCRACEAKLKKHISRMPGVKSFTVDFTNKKVTVVGDVSPLAVLSSVSKVKNAQFWPLPPLAPVV